MLVTNNEVSGEEADDLRTRGFQRADDEWEALGICRSITWPRSKATPDKRRFDARKAEVQDVLGPILIPEEEKRPLAEGFPANLAYSNLEFLDRDRAALKRAVRVILPLPWLKAGAIGPMPELGPKRDQPEPEPAFFAPPANPFAVLLDEGSLKALLGVLSGRSGLPLPLHRHGLRGRLQGAVRRGPRSAAAGQPGP